MCVNFVGKNKIVVERGLIANNSPNNINRIFSIKNNIQKVKTLKKIISRKHSIFEKYLSGWLILLQNRLNSRHLYPKSFRFSYVYLCGGKKIFFGYI